MTKRKAGSTLLGSVAAHCATLPPLVPWWKDNDKLLAAVIARAGDDTGFALRVMREVGVFAGRNRRLRSELDEAAQAPKPGARVTAQWVYELALDSYNAGRASGMNAAEAVDWLAAIFKLSTSRVSSMLTEARKRRALLGST